MVRSGPWGQMVAQKKAAKALDAKLTEHEGMLLALLSREQPVTAYQLYRIFEQSPVSSINASKGQLYPAIRRLRDRQLIKAARVGGDGRKAEELQVTDQGMDAIRRWVVDIDLGHVVLDDPLRTRMLSLHTLSKSDRMEWIASAKSLVKAKREILDDYVRAVDVPYQAIAKFSAVEALRVKMEWLDELLYAVASE
jgi:DNA-binding PadR family transcriptional regulator